ncbi:hypothetical protein ACFQ2B_30005 [Streptomyces stramineus]
MGGADHVARSFGHDTEVGHALLDTARTAYDDALTSTSLVSLGIVAVAVALAAVLVPRGFRADSAH